VHWYDWFRNSLLPAAVLLFGAMLIVRFAHWLGMVRRRGIDERIKNAIESGQVASEAEKRSRALSEAVEWVAVALTFFIAAILALEQLGVPLTTLVAPATVIGIGLGFGAQQMVGDLLAGFFLFAERQFAFGDVIRLSVPGSATSVTGTVEEITLRVTKLRNAQGELVIVPNSAMRQVTNLSKDWSRAVIDIPVPVEEDLEEVTRLLRQVIDAMAQDERWRGLIIGEPVVAGVESIEVGYVQLRLIARTLPGKQFEVGREIRLRAATVLRSSGITSPPMGDSASGGGS
jgi:small-conductance mechanosensitive channel